MPFNWTLNPYRGCTHGCHYCFARRYHVQFEMDSDDEFASVILVKRNFVEVLRRELDRPSWAREHVAFGTATDPYQPIEGHYRLTRESIGALARGRTPVGLITKGPMVIEREFSSMLPRFEKLYAKKYPPDAYRNEVKAMVRVLQQRYGLTRREDGEQRGPEHSNPSEPEQVGFAW